MALPPRTLKLMVVRTLLAFMLAAAAHAQTVCPPTQEFSPCDLVFDIPSAKGGEPIDLQAEFRSPHQNTGIAKAFWDGGTKWVIRYAVADSGMYSWRLTGSDPWNGKQGQFTATPYPDLETKPGWLRAANVHHFAFVDENSRNNLKPHLWMGALVPGFSSLSLADWKSLVDRRAAQHFNHLGITLVDDSAASAYQSPDFFRAAEEKLRYANQAGLIVDVSFFGPHQLMTRLLPTRQDRQKWFTYALSRLAAFEVTWQGIEAWEEYDEGRDLLKEIAEYLAALDPYKRISSSRTDMTSGALTDDGWLRYRSYQTADDAIGAIEQQVYRYPSVNNFGEGASGPDAFRHRLWNATMNGQYPATLVPDERAADQMKIWYEFMRDTRHWELEPFFDVQNGRGLALEGVEYIIYQEKPGPLTVTLEKHGYDARWFDPATGQSVKLKDVKTEVFTAEPPDTSHDWVLQISRESHKASMLKSYRFDSREPPLQLQEVEGNPGKVPFEVTEPTGDTISLNQAPAFAVKLTKQSKALQRMMYEWTGEVTISNRSYRVVGTGAGGTLRIPANTARDYPAALHIKVLGINGLGKVYALDRNYTLNK